MKNKNRLVVFSLLLGVIAMGSCNVYQINTVSSADNKLRQESDSSYVFENDSIRISYSFLEAKNSMPLTLRVFNKLSTPLQIDWTMSSISVNDSTISLFKQEATTTGTVNGSTWKYGRNLNTLNGEVHSTTELPQNMSFIAPKGFINVTPVELQFGFFNDLNKNDFRKITLISETDETMSQGNMATYNPENSPYKFRTYLTFIDISKKDVGSMFAIENDFFLKDVIQTKVNPQNVSIYSNSQKNTFVLSKSIGTGNVVKAIALIGAASAVAVTAEKGDAIQNNNASSN
ncbi:MULTISPECIES: hypothetical protein [Chitinophagaceae]